MLQSKNRRKLASVALVMAGTSNLQHSIMKSIKKHKKTTIKQRKFTIIIFIFLMQKIQRDNTGGRIYL